MKSPQVEARVDGYDLFHTSATKSKGKGGTKSVYEYYKREKDLAYYTFIKRGDEIKKVTLGSLLNSNSVINQTTRIIDQSFSNNEVFNRKRLTSVLPKKLKNSQKLKSVLDILTAEGALKKIESERKGKIQEEFIKTEKIDELLNPPPSTASTTQKPVKGRFSVKFTKKEIKQPFSSKVVFKKLPENAEIIETYPIQHPYSKVIIASLPELGGAQAYYIEEIELSDQEKTVLQELSDIINVEIEPPKEESEDIKLHIENEVHRLSKKYGYAKKLDSDSWEKILYYVNRELIGFGPIHVIMNDPMIEDLSVNGVGIPVYVWHRKYESVPTNLIFTDENNLDNLIIKLTHLAQKHISTAFPLLDGMLPGKDRLAATFRREVTPKGASFTIRRFREEPFSVIDLIELGTLNEEIAAYFWLLIENRMTVAVIGGTGAGKTSALNVLANLVKPEMKLVTVEEIPELNIPHENWVQMVSRESYGLGSLKTGEVSLFDLVRTSLRYRPDYIIVGEIRGEEAFVLFQALATGHGGLSTLHAESLDSAIKRLTSPPMNVAKTYINLINVAAIVQRVQLPKPKSGFTFGRRLKSIIEIRDYQKYNTVATWNPNNDSFRVDLDKSVLLKKIARMHAINIKDVLGEIENRAHLLRDLKLKGIRKNAEVAKFVANYYQEVQFPRLLKSPVAAIK